MTIDVKDFQNSAQSIKYKDMDGIARVNSFRYSANQKQSKQGEDTNKYWKEKV